MIVAELLQRPEGRSLEFKRDLSGLERVVRALVAFANTAGGSVVIGVDDDKTVVGLDDPLKDEERLARAVADSVEPYLPIDLDHASHEGKDILIATVPALAGPFYIKSEGSEDGVYVRQGSTLQRADEATIAELRRIRALHSFDQDARPEIPEDQLDHDRLERIFSAADVELDAAKLKTLGVTTEYGGRSVATNAGVILFGRDDDRHDLFPEARVRCARFRDDTKAEFLDERDFVESTVVEAIDLAEAFIVRHTSHGGEIKALRRRPIPEYHPLALRELLVNAVAHANYDVMGTPINVMVFAARLEIQNPGRFPHGTSVDTLKEGLSKIRNRSVAGVFRQLRLMESYGTGYARIATTFEDGYPEPQWDEVGDSVKVTLPQHPFYDENGEESNGRSRHDRTDEILALLARRGHVQTAEVAEALGISTRAARNWLNRLVQEQLVQPSDDPPQSPNRRYSLRPRGTA